MLRGLVWICPMAADEGLTRALGVLAFSCYKRINRFGQRATRVGNACIHALGQVHSLDALD